MADALKLEMLVLEKTKKVLGVKKTVLSLTLVLFWFAGCSSKVSCEPCQDCKHIKNNLLMCKNNLADCRFSQMDDGKHVHNKKQ